MAPPPRDSSTTTHAGRAPGATRAGSYVPGALAISFALGAWSRGMYVLAAVSAACVLLVLTAPSRSDER
ncbi:MAG: hypothetical protein H6825_16710 [Planctomycetes bacterium]|nr:hypothetical protein [Planctomycetota bacterium]